MRISGSVIVAIAKGDTRDHTRREVLQGHVNEVFKLGELNNLVKTSVDKPLGIAKQRTVQIDVLTSRKPQSKPAPLQSAAQYCREP